MGTFFFGDVLDSFNKAYKDEGSILDQTYGMKIFWNLCYEDFKFEEIYTAQTTMNSNIGF